VGTTVEKLKLLSGNVRVDKCSSKRFRFLNCDLLAISERPDFYREGHRFDSDILHKVIYNK